MTLKLVEESEAQEGATQGETVRVLIDYDLFGVNINGLTGFYIKKDARTNRNLIYMPVNSEWCELKDEWFERPNPGRLSPEASEFILTLGELTYESE